MTYSPVPGLLKSFGGGRTCKKGVALPDLGRMDQVLDQAVRVGSNEGIHPPPSAAESASLGPSRVEKLKIARTIQPPARVKMRKTNYTIFYIVVHFFAGSASSFDFSSTPTVIVSPVASLPLRLDDDLRVISNVAVDGIG